MLIDNVYIFEDIIDVEKQNILNEYAQANYKNWYYVEDVSKRLDSPKDAFKFNGWSRHVTEQEPIEEEIKSIIKEIEANALSKAGINFVKNYRYKLNCLEPLNSSPTQEELYRNTHVDDEIQHVVVLYYINDSDGDTVLFKNQNFTGYVNDTSKLEILQVIPPKKGKVVIFDGHLPHCPGWPTTSNRYVINYNVVVSPNKKQIL